MNRSLVRETIGMWLIALFLFVIACELHEWRQKPKAEWKNGKWNGVKDI